MGTAKNIKNINPLLTSLPDFNSYQSESLLHCQRLSWTAGRMFSKIVMFWMVVCVMNQILGTNGNLVNGLNAHAMEQKENEEDAEKELLVEALLTEMLNEAAEETTEAPKTERKLESEVDEEPEEELSRKDLKEGLRRLMVLSQRGAPGLSPHMSKRGWGWVKKTAHKIVDKAHATGKTWTSWGKK